MKMNPFALTLSAILLGLGMLATAAASNHAVAFYQQPTGICPNFASATSGAGVELVFAPVDMEPRNVRVWMLPQALDDDNSDLYFYFHGTGGTNLEAQSAFLAEDLQTIMDEGGILVAPSRDPGLNQFPWFIEQPDHPHPLVLVDEIIACVQKYINPNRIFATGFSAGAIFAGMRLARSRSDIFAAVAMFSGGAFDDQLPMDANPDHLMPVIAMHGGPNDIFDHGNGMVVSFQTETENYAEQMNADGKFVVTCNHFSNHSIAMQNEAFHFLRDQKYGAGFPFPAGLPLYLQDPDWDCQLP